MPERHVFQPDNAVRPHDARHATDALGKNRVALVRHRARALLAALEFLLRLAHLGPLPMANLQRKFFERRGDNCERAEILSVVIALNDLGRYRRGFQSQPRTNLLFNFRIEMRERADGAADFPYGDRLPSFG